MASEAQVQANRLNSLKSTGPTSSAGKAASRLNAVKSGIYARVMIVPGEDPAEFESMAANYQEEIQPASQIEQYLVDTLIENDWRLRRLRMAETRLWAHNPDPLFALGEIALTRIYRLIANARREYSAALKELDRQLAARSETVVQAASPVGPEPEDQAPASEPAAAAGPPSPELASFLQEQNPPSPTPPATAPVQPQTPVTNQSSSREDSKINLALRL
jgi:hypothetical protein